jgi:hypothetical protein
MKNKSLAALAYLTTAITFFGMAQPAKAQTVPNPPYPGQPPASSVQNTATEKVSTTVEADFCNSTGINGWTPGGGTSSGIGAGVTIVYNTSPTTQALYQYVAVCIVPTDLNSCNAAVNLAEGSLTPIANWYSSNNYAGVNTWIYSGLTNYCSQAFPSGSGGGAGGGSGGGNPVPVPEMGQIPTQPPSGSPSGTKAGNVFAYSVVGSNFGILPPSPLFYAQDSNGNPLKGYQSCKAQWQVAIGILENAFPGTQPPYQLYGSTCP